VQPAKEINAGQPKLLIHEPIEVVASSDRESPVLLESRP
jgi:hypothetical protein